jgi:hypothetical protein
MFKISSPRSSILLELVVGSTPRADFCMSGVRVEPVEFHLERAEDGLWLIPAYGIRDLRLNAQRIFCRTPLEAHNVIEFGGVRLGAIVSDRLPGELPT